MKKKLIILVVLMVTAAAGATLYCFFSPGAGPTMEDRWSADGRCVSDICWRRLAFLPRKVAIFKTQAWRQSYYKVINKIMVERLQLKGKKVLNVGIGSTALGLMALSHGVKKVVIADSDRLSVANARYNAKLLGWTDTVEARQMTRLDPDLFTVLGRGEKFDLILSIHHWHDDPAPDRKNHAGQKKTLQQTNTVTTSMIKKLLARLSPGGRIVLGYSRSAGLIVDRELAAAGGLSTVLWIEDNRQRFIRREKSGKDGSSEGKFSYLEVFAK